MDQVFVSFQPRLEHNGGEWELAIVEPDADDTTFETEKEALDAGCEFAITEGIPPSRIVVVKQTFQVVKRLDMSDLDNFGTAP